MNVRPFHAVLGAALSLIFTWPAVAATSANNIASLRGKAEDGNAIAQYNLGLIYADNSEPAHDLIEAYVWLSRAASNGARGRQLDILTARLTNAQIAEGNQRLGTTTPPPAAPFTSVGLDDDEAKISRLESERSQLAQDLNQARADLQRLQSSDSSTTAELRKRVAIAETALNNRESQVAALQTQLAALSNEGPSPRETELKLENARLISEVNAAAAELATLRTQNRTLQGRVETITQQSDQERERVASLATSLAADRADIVLLRARVAELNEGLMAQSNKSADLDTASTRISDLLSQLATARQGEETQAAELVAANARIQELSTKIDTARQESTQIEDRLANGATAAARVGELEAQVITNRDQINTLVNDRDRLAAELQTSNNQVATLSSEIDLQALNQAELDKNNRDQLHNLNRDHEAKLAEQQAELTEQDKEHTAWMDAARDQVEELTAELATSRANFAQLQQAQTQSGNTSSSQIAELQSELQSTREGIVADHTQLAELAAERDDLAARLQLADNQVSTLSADLAQLRQQNSNQLAAATDRVAELQIALESSRTENSARLESAATQQSEWETQVRDLTAELATTRANLAQLQQAQTQSGNTSSVQIAELQSELQSSHDVIASNREQLANLTTEREDLTARLQLADAQVSTLSADLAQSRQQNSDQLAAATDRVAELQIALESSHTENATRLDSAATQQSEWETQVHDLTAELATTRANLDQLRDAQNQSGSVASAQIAELQSDLQNSRNQAVTSQTRVSQLTQERDALAAQLQSADGQASELSTELAMARANLSELRESQMTQVDDTSTQVAQIQSELDTLRAENRALTSQLESNAVNVSDSTELRTQIESLQSQHETLQADLAATQNQNAQLVAELETERNETDSAVLQAQVEIAELREALESAQSSASTVEATADPKLQDQLDASLRAFAVQEREMVRLREQLDDASSRADAADATLGTLRDEIAGLQTANAELATAADGATSSATESTSELETQLASAQNLASTQAAEIDSLRNQLAAQSAVSATPPTDLTAQNIALREEARLAREQTASLSRELSSMRMRVAIAQPAPAANVPGRSRPSRPAAGPPTIRFDTPAQNRSATPTNPPVIAAPANPRSDSTTRTTTGPQRHTVLSGESLSTIARDFYGDGNRWPEIYRANRDSIPDPNRLSAGTPIVIP